jgi:hypothetical protein
VGAILQQLAARESLFELVLERKLSGVGAVAKAGPDTTGA